ncbi:MAG: hypothetical protein ACREIQ_11145 [Nitrospiria bacterium]
MKTLHILRRRNDHLAEAAICSESVSSASGGREGSFSSVLLIQDAVLGCPAIPVPVYVNTQDLQARGVTRPYGGTEGLKLSPPKIIDFEEICRMIVEHDRVVVW